MANPAGWLIDPQNKWVIHFESKRVNENDSTSEFTIDMWGVDTKGQPLKFKSRRKASKNDYLKTWKQLISSNWTQVDFGKVKAA